MRMRNDVIGRILAYLRTALALLTISGLALLGTGCDRGPFEEAGESIDEGFEDVGDGIEDAGDSIQDTF
jgi:hypothetical protein